MAGNSGMTGNIGRPVDEYKCLCADEINDYYDSVSNLCRKRESLITINDSAIVIRCLKTCANQYKYGSFQLSLIGSI